MMDQEQYKKILLDKFFQKNLSNDERHELERLALDDPFLFEALQGFTQVQGDHHSDLERIRSKKLKVNDRKRRSLIPYGIAASFLLLVAVSVWILGPRVNLTNDETFAEAEKNIPSNTKAKTESRPVSPMLAEDVMEIAEVETEDEPIIYSSNSEDVDVTKLRTQAESSTQGQINEQVDYVADGVDKKLSGKVDDLFLSDSSEPALPSSNPTSISNEEAIPKVDEDLEQVEEVLADELDLSTPSYDIATKNKSVEFETAKAKRAERSEAPVGGAFIDGIAVNQNFEFSFNMGLQTEFSSREIKKLKKNVVIEFDVVDSSIANFKTIPRQDNEINLRLLELVKQNMDYLPNDVNEYKIDLTSL